MEIRSELVTRNTLSEQDQKVASAIHDHVFFAFRRAQSEELLQDRTGEFHVTDANKECMRNVVYSKKYDERGIMSAEMVNILYWGQILHSHSDLNGLAHELKMCYNFVKDKSYAWVDTPEFKGFDIPAEDKPTLPYDIVMGSCDDLVLVDVPEVGKVKAIVDKKTVSFRGYKPTKAYDHHIEQINLYRLLLNKCKNMDAEWGCNIYIDRSENDKVFAFPYKLNDINKTLAELVQKGKWMEEYYKTGKLPPRVFNFLCEGYCPYLIKCSRDEQ